MTMSSFNDNPFFFTCSRPATIFFQGCAGDDLGVGDVHVGHDAIQRLSTSGGNSKADFFVNADDEHAFPVLWKPLKSGVHELTADAVDGQAIATLDVQKHVDDFC